MPRTSELAVRSPLAARPGAPRALDAVSPLPATLAGYAAFVLIGWHAVLLASLIRQIEPAFRQGDAGFGVLYLCLALAYAAGALGGGFLTERLGRRPVLAAGAAVLGAGLLGEAAAPSWGLVLAGGALAGWGAGTLDGGVNALFLALHRDRSGGALTRLHLFYSLGALAAPLLLGLLVSRGLPWRGLLAGTGVAALPVALGIFRAPMPSGTTREAPASPLAGGSPRAGERSLLPFALLALAIGLYVAGQTGISNWLVRYLSSATVGQATGVLSGFWAGLAAGRLVASSLVERLPYAAFTASCAAGTGLFLALAVACPWFWGKAVLLVLSGFFSGPVFPMIMAMGGDIYPTRLARLSGAIAASAVAGSVVYPPLMGQMASRIGLRGGLLGAAALALPCAVAVLLAARLALRARSAAPAP